MTALLEIDRLSVRLPIRREQREVLHEVSLSLDPGEALGLVGESGSGKSMTARAAARLLPPGAETGGSVRFDGAEVAKLRGGDLRRFRTRLAVVFQDPHAHINPIRKVGDFLTEQLIRVMGTKRGEARRLAVETLASVGIDDGERRLEQYPFELSGGLLQRVMIAAALLAKPDVILADEPTTALDVTTQAEIVSILNRLRQDHGVALLFITHDLDLAAAICDRTAVMYAGQILEVRDSGRLHETPLHPYTAGLGAARPSISSRAPRLRAIPGRPLAGHEVPPGCCPFVSRCTYATQECRVAVPSLRELDGGIVRCVRSEEIAAPLAAEARVGSA